MGSMLNIADMMSVRHTARLMWENPTLTMRIRDRENFSPNQSSWAVGAGGQETPYASGDYPVGPASGFTREHSADVVTKSAQKLMGQGAIIMNPFDHVVVDEFIAPADLMRFNTKVTQLPSGAVVGWIWNQSTNYSAANDDWFRSRSLALTVNTPDWPFRVSSQLPPPENLELARNECLTEAYAKAGSSDALSLVTLAEWRKTEALADEFIASRDELLEFARAAGRFWLGDNLSDRASNRRLWRDVKRARRLPVALARQWLRFRFGFMQLYYDILSFRDAMATKPQRLRFTAKRSFVTSRSTVNPTGGNVHPGTYQLSGTRTDLIRSVVLVEPRCPVLNGISDFGLDKPLTTLWELTPFSFVVDYFLNICDIMQALDGRITQNVVGSCTSHLTTYVQSGLRSQVGVLYMDESMGQLSDGTGTQCAVPFYERVREYHRIANPRFLPLPALNVKLNAKRWTDLAALLTLFAKRIGTAVLRA